MSLLILPLLSFVAAQGTLSHLGPKQPAELRALNGTQLVLKCPPAEFLVRNHMAPDFENPQLVRRLDWFHDNALVASYQQEVVSDISQQWWVSSTRYELRKPFYELGLSPLLPQDSGVYKCRLETDPLFTLDVSTALFSLVVLVKPLTPSRPQVTSYTDKSVTLVWSHSAGAAHRPILRYSILISQVDDNNLRVITTDDNRTLAVVSQLLPNTQYVFSIRAENSAGESGFGPETVFKTIGQAPSVGPKIVSLANGTIGCIDVEWELPQKSTEQAIVGYRIMVHRLGTGAMREWYVKGQKQSLCSLEFFTDYMLSIEADNGFGYSPSATSNFRTQQAAPEGPPENIVVKPLSPTTITVSWRQPSTPNGPIFSYQIYYKEHKSQKQHPTLIRLLVEAGELSKTFAYNLTKLTPLTTYKLRLSASTMVGESEKSAPMQVTTDRAPPSPPNLLHITHGGGDCANTATVYIEWSEEESENGKHQYRLMLESPNKKTLLLNSTLNRIAVNNLVPSTQYFVEAVALLPSLYSNTTYLESLPSRKETFIVYKDKCSVHSSLCSASSIQCRSLALPAMEDTPSNLSGQHSSTSFVVLLLGVLMTIALSMFFTWFLKSRCILFKEFLRRAEKKKDLKGNNHVQHSHPQQQQHHEIVSLVHDASEMVFGSTITIHQFDDYCKQLAENSDDGYRTQFQELELETSEEVFDSMTAEEESLDENNRLKNRYMNIGAVEHTRIRIFSGATADGYINANYIDSCDDKNAYIATQAPLPYTFSDFWTMVWQEKCNVIVVITNLVESGRRKCDQYWPGTSKTTMEFDNFQLTLDSEEHNSVFVHRIITLKQNNCPALTSERVIHQLHFTSWPDHGVPETVFPLLYFLNYVSEINSTGPIVVHCSAGVGRSGSFILIDSMRRHLLQCDRINIQAHLRHIRRQRARLVQTLEQYIFCHEVLRQLIRHGITRQPVLDFPSYLSFLFSQLNLGGGDARSRLQLQYEDLCRCDHDPRCTHPIGCIILPGYHRSDEFIVCNWPSECPALWTTLWEHQCQTVVLLGSDAEVSDYFRPDQTATPIIGNNNGLTSSTTTTSNGDLWLSNAKSVPMDDLQLEDQQETSNNTSIRVSNHSKDHLLLKNGSEELCVKIIRIRPSILELNTWAEIERVQDEMLPLHTSLQYCVSSQQMMLLDPRGGPTSSLPYILCALQSAACQLEIERYVDVCLFLASYRHLACGCWSSQSNVEYIYTKVLELIQMQRRQI